VQQWKKGDFAQTKNLGI